MARNKESRAELRKGNQMRSLILGKGSVSDKTHSSMIHWIMRNDNMGGGRDGDR